MQEKSVDLFDGHLTAKIEHLSYKHLKVETLVTVDLGATHEDDLPDPVPRILLKFDFVRDFCVFGRYRHIPQLRALSFNACHQMKAGLLDECLSSTVFLGEVFGATSCFVIPLMEAGTIVVVCDDVEILDVSGEV